MYLSLFRTYSKLLLLAKLAFGQCGHLKKYTEIEAEKYGGGFRTRNSIGKKKLIKKLINFCVSNIKDAKKNS